MAVRVAYRIVTTERAEGRERLPVMAAENVFSAIWPFAAMGEFFPAVWRFGGNEHCGWARSRGMGLLSGGYLGGA